MGYNHAASGLVTGIATLPLAPVAGWGSQVAWVVAFGGMALLSDLDSPNATASRMWGPVTGALSGVVGTLTGGHRGATHDAVLAPIVAGGLAAVAMMHTTAFAVVLALAIGLALRGLALTGAGSLGAAANLAVSAGGAWWLTVNGAAQGFPLPLVVAGGVLVHIAGDFLTDRGVPVPVLWLFDPTRRMGLGLFSTNRSVEKLVVAPALTGIGLLLVWRQFGESNSIAAVFSATGG